MVFEILSYMYLVAGLILLLEGSDWLLEGAASLAKKFHVHKLVIGLTIVAFGTSLPELFVSIIASTMGSSEVLLGNIIGSNIANILLILGIAAVITKVPLHRNTVWKEIPFSFFSIVVFLLLMNKAFVGLGANMLSIVDGWIMLMLFLLFIYYAFDLIIQKKIEKEEMKEEIDLVEPKFNSMLTIIGAVLVGIVALYVGGKMTVENAISVAKVLGVSEFFISATIIAIGTSLPELFVSIRAALKREMDLAVGNIVGSNIFNILLILGISALINPIHTITFLFTDIIILLAVTLLLFIFMFVGEKNSLNRWQGITFITIYIAYFLYALLR
jgi:cation:H+ antiporter